MFPHIQNNFHILGKIFNLYRLYTGLLTIIVLANLMGLVSLDHSFYMLVVEGIICISLMNIYAYRNKQILPINIQLVSILIFILLCKTVAGDWLVNPIALFILIDAATRIYKGENILKIKN